MLTTRITTMSGSPSWCHVSSGSVTVPPSRYPAFRQSGKHRRTASRSGPGLSLRRDIRPVLAVDNASVRLARSHVHTGFTERLPGSVTVRPSRYPAFRQSGKHRRTASRSGPGLSCAGTSDRCWPSTTPASGWPAPTSIPGSPNGYPDPGSPGSPDPPGSRIPDPRIRIRGSPDPRGAALRRSVASGGRTRRRQRSAISGTGFPRSGRRAGPDATASGSRWCACTAACSSGRRTSPSSGGRIRSWAAVRAPLRQGGGRGALERVRPEAVPDRGPVSTVARKGVLLNSSSTTTTCRASGLGIVGKSQSGRSVRGALVKAVNPAKRGPSVARRLDEGEYTRTLFA